MEILSGCGLGPNLQILLQMFWHEQAVVTKSGILYYRLFITERRVTQGYPVSPILFNILVGTVVREVLLEV